MIHIDGRPVEYVVDFIQNLAPIFVFYLMKCKPTEIQTKYFSFLLKHFKKILKNVKTNGISELLTQNSICNFVNYIDQDQDQD